MDIIGWVSSTNGNTVLRQRYRRFDFLNRRADTKMFNPDSPHNGYHHDSPSAHSPTRTNTHTKLLLDAPLIVARNSFLTRLRST